MTVKNYSLAVAFPKAQIAPFDRAEPTPGNWYDSFLGNIVLPVVETRKLERFWFSHYGAVGNGNHAKFRFSTDDISSIEGILAPLLSKFSLDLLAEHGHKFPHEFDIITDLVPPHEIRRLFGDNQRNVNRVDRGELVYSFLSAAATLTLHCLSHSDELGYWYRERNRDKANNHSGDTTESVHHLFCNMTSVPASVLIDVLTDAQNGKEFLVSPMYARMYGVFRENSTFLPAQF